VTGWMVLIGGAIVLGAVGCLAELFLLRATGTAWFLAVGVGIGLPARIGRRFGLPRLWRNIWLIGTQSWTVLFAIAYIATGVIHVLHWFFI
jgi:hypothetical protein